ncbi:LysR substrate-binding domain-containing protein [Piscinibacter sp.]|uniref:LysR substrate-binding domain-containing protein n=1 Tax=Piscinibacter sp. TaxID=1903157 RepID=UPI002BE41E41|nr:LysR substrate-binding domain-containing protein [Albitalea sp.]HUG26300.1 LysR substrate-binding domain-containing protein [Albitalea sp.]
MPSNASWMRILSEFGMEREGPTGLDQLKLRHLRFLIRLSELGNLGRAAEEMAMTQSAASRLLSELEHRFGRPLFDRGRFGVRLVPAASTVLRFARMVCTEEQLVKSALSAENDRPAALRIGTLPTVPMFVVEAVRRYKTERPTGLISLRQGTLDLLLPPLLDGDLDLVVGRFDPLLSQPPLQYERLLEEPLAVVARARHPLVRQRQITPQDLCRYPWVSPMRSSSLYPHFAGLFGGLPLPEDIIECASPLAMREFLQGGPRLALVGASVLDRIAASELIRLPVSVQSPPGPLGVYEVTGRMVPAETALFRKALLEESAKLDARQTSRRTRRD